MKQLASNLRVLASIGALTFSAIVQVQAQDYSASMPPVYEEPGGVSARGADSSFGVESIDPFTGALKIVVTDVTIRGNGGLDLSVVRNYQSFVKLQGGLPRREYQAGRTTTGIGWDLHFGRLWKAGADATPQLAATNTTNGCRVTNVTSKNNPVLELPDGSRRLFAASNASETGYAYITSDRWILRCLPTSQDSYSNGGAIVISPDGIKYTFNFFHRVTTANVSTNVQDANTAAAYHVTRIEHPNGTSITVSYLSRSLTYFAALDRATHSEGQVVTFNYEGNNSPGSTPNTVHLESFSNSGRTWSFNYVTAVDSGIAYAGPYEYLESITRPDGRETEYEYIGLISSSPNVDGQYNLRQVTTPLRGEVVYTYGQRTFPTRDIGSAAGPKYVVTKKEVKRKAPASGGAVGSSGGTDTWTYNYRPSTVSSNQSDFTDVRGPNSCITFEHYVGQTAGTGWQVGSLLSRRVAAPASGTACSTSAERTTTYTWVADLVANQAAFRYPLFSDSATNTPRLSRQVIEQDGRSYTTAYNDPDAFGNPQRVVETGVTRSSTGAAQSISKTTNYTYFTSTSDWILHRTKNETIENASPGTDYPIVRTFYTTGTRVGLLQTEARAGVTSSYDYYTGASAGGALQTVTDANGYVTTYSNYKRGMAQVTRRSIDGVDTLTLNRTVNDTGTIASQTDGELKQTEYSYDGISQLTGVTTARTNDSNVAIARSYSGGFSETITRGTYRETRLYDGFGTLTRTDWLDAGGTGTPAVSQKIDRDADGRVVKLYLPNSTSFVRTDYDELDRPTLVTQPDGSRVRYEYLSDNVTRVTDERGFQTLNYYRSFGDPSEQELVHIRADRADASGANSGVYQTTHIDRNLIGQVTAIIQEGTARSYRYNSRFFLYEEIHPELGTITYTHDSMGNVLSRRVGASGTTIYTLDRLYRRTGITYPDGINVTSGYYKNDNLRYVTKGATRWDYDYDLNNNLTFERLTVSGRSYILANIYDARDALSSITYPGKLVVSYSPNAFGQPMQVSSELGVHASSISYYPNGQLRGFTAGNGYRSDLGQNSRLLPSTLVSSIAINGGVTTATNLSHIYDVTGNTADIYDNRDSSQTRHMTYDGLNRLRTASGPWGSGIVTYDAKNNILTKNMKSQSLSYNYNPTTGRLDSVSGSDPRSYQYDVYGNVISNGTASTYGVFGYDDASNMIRVGPGASPAITYAYDGNSRMSTETWADGSLTRYSVYNQAGKLMYEDDPVNAEAIEYIYLGSQLLVKRSRCTSSADDDGDTLSNCVEWRTGLNPHDASDANIDTDGDGLIDRTEIQMGANLYSVDTDSDGLSDSWEVGYGLNALRADSNADSDQDGLTNLQEYHLGTSPVDADTDNDGKPDGTDPNPRFNPAVMVPLIEMILE